MRATDLLVAFGIEPGDDEIALLVKEEKAAAILDDKSIGPADGFAGGSGLEGLPDPLAGVRFEAAQLAIAAHTVDVSVLEKGRAHDRVEVFGVLLAGLFRAPNRVGRRFALLAPRHTRA